MLSCCWIWEMHRQTYYITNEAFASLRSDTYEYVDTFVITMDLYKKEYYDIKICTYSLLRNKHYFTGVKIDITHKYPKEVKYRSPESATDTRYCIYPSVVVFCTRQVDILRHTFIDKSCFHHRECAKARHFRIGDWSRNEYFKFWFRARSNRHSYLRLTARHLVINFEATLRP